MACKQEFLDSCSHAIPVVFETEEPEIFPCKRIVKNPPSEKVALISPQRGRQYGYCGRFNVFPIRETQHEVDGQHMRQYREKIHRY